ncbi:MAG TPA: DinB family protein [Longimicrobiaceae bacterium]|nr:DinB family protein [Longimicrobiaceae bacterium]
MPESPEHSPAPDAAAIADHIERLHARTRRLVVLIPPDDVEWSPHPGWFTLGGLVRHMAGTERWLFAECARDRPSRYPGHGPELASGLDAVVAYYDRLHAESAAIFASLDSAALTARIATPAGARMAAWKWLRGMNEHEAHHRGQLYLMLAMRGVATPPIFGLTAEEVQARSEPLH